MSVDVPVSQFDAETPSGRENRNNFVNNLATLLGIDPTRIRIAAVNPARRLSRASRKVPGTPQSGGALPREVAPARRLSGLDVQARAAAPPAKR